jgi:hypothetical protein
MRPAPKARHLVAITVFVATAALAHVLAAHDDDLTDEQVGQAVNVIRSLNGDLYAQDPVYGASGLWRLDAPIWQWYWREAFRSTGQLDILAPLRWLVGPTVLVYLLGMYGLLWRQCRSWSVACYVSVLSLAVMPVAGGGEWGIGPLSAMTAGGVGLALVPWVAWAFLWRIDSPSVLWVFLLAGLVTNVDPSTGMNLTILLAIALVVHRRFSWRGWGLAVLGGFCAAGAAGPYLWHAWSLHATYAGAAAPGWPLVAWAIRQHHPIVLLPALLRQAVELSASAYALVLWIPAITVMTRLQRFRVSDQRVWVALLAGGLAVGLALHGASQLVGMLRGTAPPVLGFVQALALTLLPLYVLLAQAVVHVLRMGTSRWALRLTLAAMMAAWLVPADNLAVPRHWVEDTAAAAVSPENRPDNVTRRAIRQAREQELRAIGLWIQGHAPADAVVVCEDARMRLWAHRSLVACREDAMYFYCLAPEGLRAWTDLLVAQREVLRPRAGRTVDVVELAEFARLHGAQYAVVRADEVPAPGSGPGWVAPPSQEWGEYWQLWNLYSLPSRPPTPANNGTGAD